MIDQAELGRMTRRAEAASRAVGAVLARRGLFSGLSYDDPVELLERAAESAQDVPALLAEVRRLAPASYLRGPEECLERECDHWYDSDGNPVLRDEGDLCPHVEVRAATLGDVKRAEYLDRLVAELRGRLVQGDVAEDLVERIDGALDEMRADEDIAVVAADGLVGAGEPGSPQGSGPDHGAGEVVR